MIRFAALGALTWLTSLGCGSGDEAGRHGEDGFPYQPVDTSGRVEGERNLAVLLDRYSEGRPRNGAWSGYWWPYLENGISSASGKYGQAFGRGEATGWERENHGASVPGVASWWGHCNGWAAASVLAREPREARSRSGQAFGVSDQKALLSELGMEVDADFFGIRDNTSDPDTRSFQDVFPNQFLLVLTNYVGRGFPLVMDRYTGVQVWNHPIAGYRIAPVTPEDDLGPHPSRPSVHRVRLTLRVWWLRADVDPEHLTEPFAFEDGGSYESRTLRAEIWLDGPLVFTSSGRLERSGDVVLGRDGNLVFGGAWMNGSLPLQNSHPDYLWVPLRFRNSSGYSNPHIRQEDVISLLR